MDWRFIPKPTPNARVGRALKHYPNLRSDLIVMTDVEDGNGNTYPDALVPKRYALPLPNEQFMWSSEYQVCDMSGEDFDLATLHGFMYVRLVDAFDVSSVGFSHGFVSEVVAIPTRLPMPAPAVGEHVVHYEPHTFWVDKNYAFVAIYDPNTQDFTESYVGRAVPV